jgi:hypothetical protein
MEGADREEYEKNVQEDMSNSFVCLMFAPEAGGVRSYES